MQSAIIQAEFGDKADLEAAPKQPSWRTWNSLMAAHVAAFTALGCFCAVSQRYLFADGANFFLGLLNTRAMIDWCPPRDFAYLLTQYPAVMLIQDFGCRDAKLIGLTYGLTLFLVPVAGLLITWWAAWKTPGYLVFPLLTHSILFLTTSFVIIAEVFPAVALFWCLLYLLKFSSRLTWARSACLIICGVLATRAYESYLFLAWPLVFAAWQRGRDAWKTGRKAEVLVALVCGLLFLDAFLIAAGSTFYPRDSVNRGQFAKSLVEHLAYAPVRFSLVVIGAALWSLFLPGRSRGAHILGALVWLHALVVIGMPIVQLSVPWSLQYASRVQSLYLPLLFGSLVVWNPPALRSLSLSSGQIAGIALWRLTALTCAVSVLFQWSATVRWNEYRLALLDELSQRRGVIAFEDSVVYNPLFEQEITPAVIDELLHDFSRDPQGLLARLHRGQFNWGWAMPSLSITLSALNLDAVTTIVCAPKSTGWQPFDPQRPEKIPNLADYGVPNKLASESR